MIFKTNFIKKDFDEFANYEINVHNRMFINMRGKNLVNFPMWMKH